MKNILREKVSSIIGRLEKDEIKEKSNIIFNRLIKLDLFNHSKNIGCYISNSNEVDTIKIVKLIIENNGKAIVPFLDGKMMFSELNDFNELIKGKFGILEPKNKKIFSKDKLDLVLIPGIVFDKKGNRIGRGKGHYDKYLKDSKVKKIALAYDFQVIDEVVSEKHDVKIDYIITDKKIIDCKND